MICNSNLDIKSQHQKREDQDFCHMTRAEPQVLGIQSLETQSSTFLLGIQLGIQLYESVRSE